MKGLIVSIFTITLTFLAIFIVKDIKAQAPASQCGNFPDCQGTGSCTDPNRTCRKYQWCVDEDGDGECESYEWGCRCLVDTPDPTGTPAPTLPPPVPQPDPIPPPYVDCQNVRPDLLHPLSPEFHSLRPYQASPCDQEKHELALFCGNTLTLADTFIIEKRFLAFPISGDITLPTIEGFYYYEGNPIDPESCVDNGDGTETCNFIVEREKDIIVDLSGAYLPIMGNTEGVVNSQNQPDPEPISDSQKVNEYVSWYLQGVPFKAEYPYLDVNKNCIGENTGKPGYCLAALPGCMWSIVPPIPAPLLTPDGKSSCGGLTTQCCVSKSPLVEPVDILGRDKLINFSGPIKKQLPFYHNFKLRNDEIIQAKESLDNTIPPAEQRHDQYVACSYEIPIRIPFLNVTVDIKGPPAPCYDNFFLNLFKVEQRLVQTSVIIPTLLESRGWYDDDKLAPLSTDPEFDTFTEYWIAYKEWRGQSCYTVEFPDDGPFVGLVPPIIRGWTIFMCFDSPLNPNIYGTLFPYIPFSSTEDRMGEVDVESATIQPGTPGVQILDMIVIADPADLFFPHMQESAELAEILQKTYAYQDANLNSPVSSVEPLQWCDLTEVRSNPGDNLFAGEIDVHIEYTALVSATFTLPGEGRICEMAGGQCQEMPSKQECSGYSPHDCEDNQHCIYECTDLPTGACDLLPLSGDYDCVPSSWESSCNEVVSGGAVVYCPAGYICGIGCEGEPETTNPFPISEEYPVTVYPSLDTITKTPKADEVWSRLVAGEAGVFKRIFPKVEEGAPVEAIKDIPAASPVSYRSLDGTPIIIGNPSNQRSGAELYFPHIGGIHQYFLQCIQTALRPEGWGEGCLTGSADDVIGDFICPRDTIPNMPTNPSCTLSHSQISVSNVPPLMRSVFEAAGAAYNVPPDLIAGIMFAEGGFDDRVSNPGCYGEVAGEYTEETIENAILCQFKNCNPDTDLATICNYDDTQPADFCVNGYPLGSFGPYQQCPSGYNPCNFYDATMAMASFLAGRSFGDPSFAGESCLGVSFNTDGREGPISCQKSAWTCRDVITAIRGHVGLCIDWHFCNVLSVYGACDGGC
jgi:hypothetical protein